MNRLPTFRRWTIDQRLQEFRQADPERGLVSVPFDSRNGRRLAGAIWRLQQTERQQSQ